MLISVRNGDATLPYLSSYDIEFLITNLATLYLLQFDYYHKYIVHENKEKKIIINIAY